MDGISTSSDVSYNTPIATAAPTPIVASDTTPTNAPLASDTPDTADRFTPSDDLKDPHYATQALDSDPKFTEMRKTDSLGALRSLYQRNDLPGDSAKDRTDFVLGYTSESGNNSQSLMPDAHFRPTADFDHGVQIGSGDNRFNSNYMFNDTGFDPKYQDGGLWPKSSNQVGHFLTAVDVGEHDQDTAGDLYKSAAVGHELTGDDNGKIPQTLKGTFATSDGGFDKAIQAARDGDDQAVENFVKSQIPQNPTPDEKTRSGNSQQDLRLTTYGVALGEMMRDGTVASRAQVVNWINQHLRAPGWE